VKKSKDERFEADIRSEFATKVHALYKARLARIPVTIAYEPDVRRVAYGLVALRQALDHFLEHHRKEPMRLAAGGVFEADDILAALVSGTAHPISKYLQSLKSSGQRHSRPPPSQREQSIRAMLAGAVLAYEKTGSSREEAAKAVSAGIRTAERKFSAGQLKQWIVRNGEAPAWFAGQFAADAVMVPDCDSAGERILIVAREALDPLLAVPA
jgi:hypothetical protein